MSRGHVDVATPLQAMGAQISVKTRPHCSCLLLSMCSAAGRAIALHQLVDVSSAGVTYAAPAQTIGLAVVRDDAGVLIAYFSGIRARAGVIPNHQLVRAIDSHRRRRTAVARVVKRLSLCSGAARQWSARRCRSEASMLIQPPPRRQWTVPCASVSCEQRGSPASSDATQSQRRGVFLPFADGSVSFTSGTRTCYVR